MFAVLSCFKLIVYIVRWNCAVRARKLQNLQEILWMTIITCLVISNIEFIQYLIFKTCWVNFLFPEKNKIITEPVENTAGYSKYFILFFFKTPGKQHKLTKNIQSKGSNAHINQGVQKVFKIIKIRQPLKNISVRNKLKIHKTFFRQKYW